jgi:N-acetylmuramoyl-L-alanine amidase
VIYLDNNERREQWKREHIKAKKDDEKFLPAIITTAVVLVALVFCVYQLVTSLKGTSKVEYILSKYNGTVMIGENEIQAYNINGSSDIYISLDDLPSVGLRADFDGDNSVNISMTNAVVPENDWYLDGEKVKSAKKLTVSASVEEQYGKTTTPSKTISNYYTSGSSVILSLKNLVDASIIDNSKPDVNGNIASQILLDKTGGVVSDSTPQPRQANGDSVINVDDTQTTQSTPTAQINASSTNGRTIFLDAGHGKDSGSMSSDEKINSGWTQNSSGNWGEWRHWTNGEYGNDCQSNDGAVSQPNDCWYPIGNGDRDTEPNINLQNCLAAKRYLESMGYNVVLSRESNNENPSITHRIEMAQNANADAYICVHSNAGGGRGSAYIALSEDSSYYSMSRGASYASEGNRLGRMINNEIVSNTDLSEYAGGSIDGEPYLILFQKAPMLCAYLEIGFFDNSSDLSILQSNSDAIGKAIADGINNYFSGN